jgi:DNA-binding protein HU-beta
MNQEELKTAIADKAGLTKKNTGAVLKAFQEIVMETVAEGESVTLVGFGTFEARSRKEKKGRNPKTNEEMIIPAYKAPHFKAGKGFKEKVK